MAAQTLTRGRLRRLADVHPDRGRVLSVFMNLDPSEFATPAARSSQITSILTEAARRVEEAGDLEHDERTALKADVERVREVLSGDIAGNGTRALAVFACQPEDLLEVVALREPLESRVVLDDAPFVEPLVYAGATDRWCVVLCNRRVARLFTGPGDELEETDRIEDDVHSRHDQGGWSQARYQRSVDKEAEDHLQHTAEVAFELFKQRGFDRMLTGGPDETIGDLEAKLHPYLKERLVGRVSCDVEDSSLDHVRSCAGGRILEFARAREREALDRLAQGVGSGGRGAAGLSQVLAAVNESRVEVLLVARGMSAAGFCDPATGLLYATPEEVPDGATAAPVADVVEKAIERALEQSAEVMGIRHHDDLGPLGGIGAVLRYTL
jgi:peptide chain release factor subunit 1